ncbi:aldo/keto reductase [Streptomyces sp. NPDC090088]|uniref:aldo/keto reductase n=1 Tax=Streptomyces sp. NPDC090088 TaxID=3365944 RepID=UPI00382F5EA9
MATDTFDSFILNNGVVIPAVGLGVFQSPPAETAAAVQAALEVGYRHVDTAAAYFNERQVGDGLRASGLDRSEVFIQTKVWVSDYGYDETLHAFEKSATKPGIDYLDLLILHQPMPQRFERTVAAYRALETLLAEGRVRAIGVSNFLPHHLRALLEQTDVVPAVNQVELHPYFTQPEVQATDAEHGILTQAWSPIGGITFYGARTSTGTILQDSVIADIAQVHRKSVAQVMLRWHLQHGRQVIPKSVHPVRIAENFAVFDFQLTTDELARLDGLSSERRRVPHPDSFDPLRMGLSIPEV